MNELVKVISLSFDDQKKLGKGIKMTVRTHVGEVTDDNGVVVAKISKSLNNMTIMVEIDGAILGLNTDAFVHHIFNNHKKYTEAEYNNGKTLFSITHHNKYSLVPDDFLNGTIPFRFWFDEYAEIKLNVYTSLSTTYFESFNSWDNVPYEEQSGVIDSNYLEDITQVSFPDMKAYAKGKTLYAWHIKKLEIFDEPLSLNDFYKATLYASGKVIKEYEKQTDDFSYRLQRPPQSYQYVYTKELENE